MAYRGLAKNELHGIIIKIYELSNILKMANTGQTKTNPIDGKDLLLSDLEGRFPVKGRKEPPTKVDLTRFNFEEQLLLEKEVQKWKGEYGKKEWSAVHDDIKRKIGLLIQSKTINNVNKKLINRGRY